MHTLTSFDGLTFSTINWEAEFPAEALRGQWDVGSAITPRSGNTSSIAPGPIAPRRLPVDFVYIGSGDVRNAIDELIGYLDPRDQTERLLVGARYDGTVVQRYAKVEMPAGFDSGDHINVVRAVFVSEEPEWARQTATTASQSGATSPLQLAHTNAGRATVWPVYQTSWTVQRGTKGTVVGQQYRKRMTLTNNQDRVLGPFPYGINLGDTAALVTAAKAQADGDDLRIIVDGVDMPRVLIGWNRAYGSQAWIVIPGMDALEVLTIDVVYGNASATNPPGWTDPDPDKPVLDLYNEFVTATSGTTTTIVKSSGTWESNRFHRGEITALSGTAANIGLTRQIDTNTATQITVFTAFPAAVAANDTFLITMSDNDRWMYAVRDVDRKTEYFRGRYYINSASNAPSVVSYEAPGSWRPELVWDNRDAFGIKRYSRQDVGAGDLDSFAWLDARRSWEGNVKKVPQVGSADGLALTTPVPIVSLIWEMVLTNPNGMCKLSVGVRASGAEDWAEAYSVATAGTYTAVDQVNVQSAFGDCYQIVTALGPADDNEIDLDWRRDTGTATAGTTTTLTDGAKEWATNQFANGTLLMLSGANKGRAKTVSSNTGTVLTVSSAFPAAIADGDRYVVTNKRLLAELRDDDVLIVNLDATKLSASALGAETNVYEESGTIWVGAGPAASPTGQHRALLGWAGGEKRLFLASDERVEIDAANRRVRIWNTTSSTYTRDLADPEVILQYHDGTAWRRSANWLPLAVGAQNVWLEETNMGTRAVSISYYASYLG